MPDLTAKKKNTPQTSFISMNSNIDSTDIEEVEAAIANTQKRWTSLNGSMFWGAGDVLEYVPAGSYLCKHSERTGFFLEKLSITTDSLVNLPHMVCNDVVSQIEEFWSDKMAKNFKKRGFLRKRGILMFGEPGSGKTSTIQKLISLLIERGGIALFPSDPEVFVGCLQMIRRIEPNRPIIAILEDFEILTERKSEENDWLSVLDGEAQVDNIVFIATTNYIDRLDKRFVDRPSRFDFVVPIPMPSAKARASFLKQKEKSLTNEEIYEWVVKTENYSIAHLKELIIANRCYGHSLDDAISRLNKMKERNFNTDDMEMDASRKQGLGFTSKPVTDGIDKKELLEYIKSLG